LAQDAAFSYEEASTYLQLNYNWVTSGGSRFLSDVKAAKRRNTNEINGLNPYEVRKINDQPIISIVVTYIT